MRLRRTPTVAMLMVDSSMLAIRPWGDFLALMLFGSFRRFHGTIR